MLPQHCFLLHQHHHPCLPIASTSPSTALVSVNPAIIHYPTIAPASAAWLQSASKPSPSQMLPPARVPRQKAAQSILLLDAWESLPTRWVHAVWVPLPGGAPKPTRAQFLATASLLPCVPPPTYTAALPSKITFPQPPVPAPPSSTDLPTLGFPLPQILFSPYPCAGTLG